MMRKNPLVLGTEVLARGYRYPGGGHGLVPREKPARERQPRARVGLHDGGRRTAPMRRPRQDLHGAGGRHTHLDRAARMRDAELLEGEAHRRQHDRARRLLAGLWPSSPSPTWASTRSTAPPPRRPRPRPRAPSGSGCANPLPGPAPAPTTLVGMASVSDWIEGARLRTLPAAAAPVIVGSAAAHYLGGFQRGARCPGAAGGAGPAGGG